VENAVGEVVKLVANVWRMVQALSANSKRFLTRSCGRGKRPRTWAWSRRTVKPRLGPHRAADSLYCQAGKPDYSMPETKRCRRLLARNVVRDEGREGVCVLTALSEV